MHYHCIIVCMGASHTPLASTLRGVACDVNENSRSVVLVVGVFWPDGRRSPWMTRKQWRTVVLRSEDLGKESVGLGMKGSDFNRFPTIKAQTDHFNSGWHSVCSLIRPQFLTKSTILLTQHALIVKMICLAMPLLVSQQLSNYLTMNIP